MGVEPGRFPKCESCRQVNGDPAATRHRRVHVSAHGKQSCVDEHLTGLMVALWEVADTTDCGAGRDGRAYVVPTPDTASAAEPPPMSAADILPTLHQLAQRVAEARDVFATVTAGVQHPRILSTAGNLDEARQELVAGMRADAKPFQQWSWRTGAPMHLLGTAVLVPPVWLATVAASALTGGPVTWMLVVALAAYGLIAWPYLRLSRQLSDVLTRHRIRRTLADPTWDASDLTTPDQQERTLSLICVELLDIDHTVDGIRADLAAVGRVRLGTHPPNLHGSGAGLIRACTHDAALAWLIDADTALAGAGDNIRLWLSLPRG